MKLSQLRQAIDDAIASGCDPDDTTVILADCETFEQFWVDLEADGETPTQHGEPGLFKIFAPTQALGRA